MEGAGYVSGLNREARPQKKKRKNMRKAASPEAFLPQQDFAGGRTRQDQEFERGPDLQNRTPDKD